SSSLHPPFVHLGVNTVIPHCVGPQTRLRTAMEGYYSSTCPCRKPNPAGARGRIAQCFCLMREAYSLAWSVLVLLFRSRVGGIRHHERHEPKWSELKRRCGRRTATSVLGLSEESALARSCRRWFGMPPSRLRRLQAVAQGPARHEDV